MRGPLSAVSPACPGLWAVSSPFDAVPLALTLLAAAVVVLIWRSRPLTLIRPFLWIIAHTIYRLRVTGLANLRARPVPAGLQPRQLH